MELASIFADSVYSHDASYKKLKRPVVSNTIDLSAGPLSMGDLVGASIKPVVMNKTKKLAIHEKIVVNNDLRKIDSCSNKKIIVKEIPVNLSKSAVEFVFSKFEKIVLIKIQLIGLWQKALVKFKSSEIADLVAVKWNLHQALLYTLSVGIMTHDLFDLLELYGGKTCFIGCNPSFYAHNICVIVCFADETSKLAAIGSILVFKGVNLHWTGLFLACCANCKQFGHVSNVCSAGENSGVCRIKPLVIASNSFDDSGLADCMASLECSVKLLSDQVFEILRKLSFVKLVLLLSPSCVPFPIVTSSLNSALDSDIVVNSVVVPPSPPVVGNAGPELSLSSLKVLTTKVSGLESKMMALEVSIGLVLMSAFSVIQFFQTGEINSFIAKAINEAFFIVLGGDFNKDDVCKCASFKRCLDLRLVNSLLNSPVVKVPIWKNLRGVKKTIDYVLVSSNLVNAVLEHSIVNVNEYFDTDYQAISVIVDLSGLLDMKSYHTSKLAESLAAKKTNIRAVIDKKIENFETNKGHTIKSVLKHPFYKVVLDYLPLDYVFNKAFSGIMCLVKLSELLDVISNLPDGKAAGLSGITNELWKHCDKSILNMLLMEAWVLIIPKPYKWKGVLMNTHPIALIKTACKILSKIFSDRISLACNTFNSLIFAVGSVIKDALKKNQELWLVLVITDFGLIDNYCVHDGLDQGEVFSLLLWCIFYDSLLCEVKRQESICGYKLSFHFISKNSHAESQAGLSSFFAAGAFIDDTIWVGSNRAATQHIFNIANEFFQINNIFINNDKTVAIPINSKVSNPSFSISGLPISISLSKPSLVKANSDVCFFTNLVLKKTVSDKQFLYLVSAVLHLIVSYRMQFNALIHKGLKFKSGLPFDFPSNTIYHSFFYGLKSFFQVQSESKVAFFVSFVNSGGILDLGMVHVLLDCNLSLGGSLTNLFWFYGRVLMSIVLEIPAETAYTESDFYNYINAKIDCLLGHATDTGRLEEQIYQSLLGYLTATTTQAITETLCIINTDIKYYMAKQFSQVQQPVESDPEEYEDKSNNPVTA
ncbi:hypothetical protein G9A89_009567 [Geosiphon pyriformis]|nr:hypothetical protein G9A89_009567 [Geosiphon pyriformis]